MMAICLITMTSGCRAENYKNTKSPYIIYDNGGSKVTYDEMIKDVSKHDVCLFGELHNDPISHWLELSMIEDLHEHKGENLIVGAEMWERDNQNTLDEFLKDRFYGIDTYVDNSRLWKNFTTDYRPILEYVAYNCVRFIATNVPRRYAHMVSESGFKILDSLENYAKSYLAPLPLKVDYEEKVYAIIAESFKQMSAMPMVKRDVRHLVEAQALKDATMAWFISQNRGKDDLFFHFHGEMHSAYHSAIGHYLAQYAPKTRTVTISVTMSQDIYNFKPKDDRADYYIVIPQNMTKTYAE